LFFDLYCRSLFIPLLFDLMFLSNNWFMAAMGTLVMYMVFWRLFSFISLSCFNVVNIADSFHWNLVTVHRYTASRVKQCTCAHLNYFNAV